MNYVVSVLAHWQSLQPATDTVAGTSSSSTVTITIAAASSSSSSRAASSSRQQLSSSALGQQWLPAALAPSMATVYHALLKQLGCSREVGLWVAMNVKKELRKQAGNASCGRLQLQASSLSDHLEGAVVGGMVGYGRLVQALSRNSIYHPELAPLQLLSAAASFEWVSSMSPARLLVYEPCVVVCQLAGVVCGYGQNAQNCMPPEAGGWDQYTAVGKIRGVDESDLSQHSDINQPARLMEPG